MYESATTDRPLLTPASAEEIERERMKLIKLFERMIEEQQSPATEQDEEAAARERFRLVRLFTSQLDSGLSESRGLQTKGEQRKEIKLIVETMVALFGKANERQFAFSDVLVRWDDKRKGADSEHDDDEVPASDPDVIVATTRDQWYKLSQSQQTLLLRTLATSTNARILLRVDGWRI
jgi:hypothetical protein